MVDDRYRMIAYAVVAIIFSAASIWVTMTYIDNKNFRYAALTLELVVGMIGFAWIVVSSVRRG